LSGSCNKARQTCRSVGLRGATRRGPGGLDGRALRTNVGGAGGRLQRQRCRRLSLLSRQHLPLLALLISDQVLRVSTVAISGVCCDLAQ